MPTSYAGGGGTSGGGGASADWGEEDDDAPATITLPEILIEGDAPEGLSPWALLAVVGAVFGGLGLWKWRHR